MNAQVGQVRKLRGRREVPALQEIFAYNNFLYPHERSSEPRTMKDLCSASCQLRCTAVLACALLFATPGHANDRNSDVDRLSTYVIENDDIVLDDGGYTSGLGYIWSYGPFDSFAGRTSAWTEWLTEDLYIARMKSKQRRISYQVIQEIYTPEEINVDMPDPKDRPYAGIVTWQASWFAYDERLADRLLIELGIVGSASLAEQLQKGAHTITGANEPKGWDEQLENEPIFRLGAQRNWRLHNSAYGHIEYDVISQVFGAAGTRRSDLGGGLSFRFGKGLGRSLANVSLTPARDVNLNAGHTGEWYGFISLGGAYVFNDITLDGNTFETGPSVEIEHWQASASIGAVWNLGNWGLLISIRGLSDEFETQEKDSLYGSLSISYHLAGEQR